MPKISLFLIIFSFFSITDLCYSQAYLKHEIENENQSDFPGIKINDQDSSHLYSINLDQNKGAPSYQFEKSVTLPKNTSLKISSYIISKEIMDALNINSLAARTDRNEFMNALKSSDDKTVTKFIIKMAEKRRGANDVKELEVIKELIKKRKTDDEPQSTVYFKTGFIEVKPLENSEIRYFIPFSNHKSISINAKEGKVTLLQSMTLLTFKKLKSSLNFGYLSDEKIKDLTQLEDLLQNACNQDCLIKNQDSLASLVLGVIDLSGHDFLQDLSLSADKINDNISLAHACLILSYLESCPNEKLLAQLKKSLPNHANSLSKACKSLGISD